MNAETLDALSRIGGLEHLYHRLMLIVGPSGSGKTQVLQGLATELGVSLINLNQMIAKGLLELSTRQRSLQLPRVLDGIVASEASPLILDNTEILFDTTLQQDPLRLLQGVSRNKVVVASWNGKIRDGHLEYAVPDHAEFRRYPADQLVLVRMQNHDG